MAWGEIENLDGKIEVVFYPRTFENFSSLIRANSIVFVKGEVRKSEEKIKLIAEEVANLNTAKEKFLSKVEIDIRIPVEESKLQIIKEIIEKNKGSSPLYINIIEDGKGKVKIKANGYTVNPDIEFIEEIKKILGSTSIHLGL